MPESGVVVEVARIAEVLARMPRPHSGWLSESEQARLSGLRHGGRRDEYLAGHWLVRELLARRHDNAAWNWRLGERRGLPPEVVGPNNATNVAISHADGWLAAAVAPQAIGIDLEGRSRRLDEALEPFLLNPGEPPGQLDSDALLKRWVAKEAWIKRRGGSALPSRLRQIRLVPAAWEEADIRLATHLEFHLGVALAGGCQLSPEGAAGPRPDGGFRVIDAGPLEP